MRLISVMTPNSPDAEGIYDAILTGVNRVSLAKAALKKKLVGNGFNGWEISAVAAHLTNLQPDVVIVHSYQHQLQLAYKDAIKSSKIYEGAVVLLVSIIYLYFNSHKTKTKSETTVWGFWTIACLTNLHCRSEIGIASSSDPQFFSKDMVQSEVNWRTVLRRKHGNVIFIIHYKLTVANIYFKERGR